MLRTKKLAARVLWLSLSAVLGCDSFWDGLLRERSAEPGKPCSAADGACPAGQSCNLAIGQCQSSDTLSDGGVAIPDLPPPNLTPICLSSGRYCWENPLPQGNPLYSVFVLADNDVWIGGDYGTLLHFDGSGWQQSVMVVGDRIRALWGADSANVWALSSTAIQHWDGTAWTIETAAATALANVGSSPAQLTAVWGFSSDDIWFVGNRRTLHKSGGLWQVSALETYNYSAIWGSDPNNLWATGCEPGSGACYIFNRSGEAWNIQTTTAATSQPLVSLHGTAANDVWGVGNIMQIYHWNGSVWTQLAPPAGLLSSVFSGVTALSRNQVWITGPGVLFHGNVDGFGSNLGPTLSFNAIGGRPGGTAWAVGDLGLLRRWNGYYWEQWSKHSPESGIRALWGSSENNLWAGGDDGIYKRIAAGQWVKDSSWGGVRDLTGLPSGTLLGATSGGVVSGLPGMLTYSALPNASGVENISLWQNSDGKAWAMSRFDGGGSRIWYRATTTWVQQDSVGQNLFKLWGADANNLWAVGSAGRIRKYNGSTWADQTSNTTENLIGIWGSSSTNIWAIGDLSSGRIFHWDGVNWASQTPAAFSARFKVAIAGAGAANIWVTAADAAGQGRALQYDGSVWTERYVPTNIPMDTVWGDPISGKAWFAGRGAIWRYTP